MDFPVDDNVCSNIFYGILITICHCQWKLYVYTVKDTVKINIRDGFGIQNYLNLAVFGLPIQEKRLFIMINWWNVFYVNPMQNDCE